MPPRPTPRRITLLAAACSLAILLPGSPRAAAPARPPVMLVETRPIETTLGDPAIAGATETWLALIGGARTSIDLEHFYLSPWPGEPLDPVLESLGAAAKRGVRVRMLLDARMYRTYPRTADSLAKVKGIEVRLVDFGRIAGGVQHAKYFVFDRETVLIGSQNLDWRALKHIHEMGVAVRDRRVAAEFERVFAMDWAMATPPGAPPDTTKIAVRPLAMRTGALPYRVVQGPGDTVTVWPSWSPRSFSPDTANWDLTRLVGLIDGAKAEVAAQMLSYHRSARGVEDPSLDDALRRAAARGVMVRILVSDWNMGPKSLDDLKALVQLPNVEVRLSTVPEWSGGYVPFARVEHVKMMVVDSETAWIGTSNWDPSYFHSSRNLAMTLGSKRLAGQLRKVFETSWTFGGTQPLDPAKDYPAKIRGEEPPPGATKYGG